MSDSDKRTKADAIELANKSLAILIGPEIESEWHHSVAFNGEKHTTACGIDVKTKDTLITYPKLAKWPEFNLRPKCSECTKSIESLPLENVASNSDDSSDKNE